MSNSCTIVLPGQNADVRFSKPSTDMAYNNSIATIISTLSHQLNSTEPHKALSVVFGTHNSESCDLVISNLVKYGLASPAANPESSLLRLRDDVVGKVYVAQLYGMKDDLTDKMSESFENNGMPIALKVCAANFSHRFLLGETERRREESKARKLTWCSISRTVVLEKSYRS